MSSRTVAALVFAVALVVVTIAVVVNRSPETTPGHPAPGRPSNSTPATSSPAPDNPSIAPVAEGPPVPSKGAYLGAWVEPEPFTQPGRVASFRRFETALGHPLKIVHLYRRWGDAIGTSSDRAFAAHGKYLLLSWATPDTRQLASGRDDNGIARAAREIRALRTQVFLEPRWEMDRPNLRATVHSGADYIAAWRHIRAVFSRYHVTNVAWTWCPTAAGFLTGDAPAYYPGDKYVDWVCADVYPMYPWAGGTYESFPQLVEPFMSWAANRHKPVMIGEFGAQITYGPRRVGWIEAAGAYIRAHEQIKAALWFEQSRPIDPPYQRYGLQGDRPALRAFAALANDPWFAAGD